MFRHLSTLLSRNAIVARSYYSSFSQILLDTGKFEQSRQEPIETIPSKFFYKPTISQLGRKSVVAVNMATLRLDGDDVNYDAESVRSQEILV
uniref:Uncharacterized protein n=1 Tax=Ditylenchus dipsaci TaxID=166011 RepID=A0A915E559_9BILA